MSSTKTKQDRFKDVASKRVQKLLDSIDNLTKCANRRNYEYSEEDVRKMMRVINDKMAVMKNAYMLSSKSGKETFEF
jgi:aspartate carbamoyltransferase regulatory subunit